MFLSFENQMIEKQVKIGHDLISMTTVNGIHSLVRNLKSHRLFLASSLNQYAIFATPDDITVIDYSDFARYTHIIPLTCNLPTCRFGECR